MNNKQIILMLSNLKDLADQVESETGIQPSAQEALDWAISSIQDKTYLSQTVQHHHQPLQLQQPN
jgi:hypothetical protein